MDLELIYRARGQAHRHRMAPGRIRIGRATDCEVVIEDGGVELVHAIARFDGKHWVLMAAADQAVLVVDGQRLKYLVLGPLTQVIAGGTRMTLVVHRHGTAGKPDAASLASTQVRSSRQAAEVDTAIAAERAGGSAAVAAPATLTSALALLRGTAAVFAAETDVDAVLAMLADLVFEHLLADHVSVLLGEGPAAALVPCAVRSRHASDEGFAISHSIADEALSKRGALLVDVTTEGARFGNADNVIDGGIRSAVCAPLVGARRVHGLVWADRTTGKFDAGDLDVLAVLASLAATAVQRRSAPEQGRPFS